MIRSFITTFAVILVLTAFTELCAASERSPLPRFATHQRTDISCLASPFGRQVEIGSDNEAMYLFSTSSGLSSIDEYMAGPDAAQPLVRNSRSDLLTGNISAAAYLASVAVDLDGDGRQEIVTAHRRSGTNTLRLAVHRRTAGPGSAPFDYWDLDETFDDVQLVSGDFDGSSDGAKELAVLLRSGSNLKVIALNGDTSGGISEANNVTAGQWTRSGSTSNVSLASGGLLLNGRDQIVVVSQTGSNPNTTLNYHLLEFQSALSALPDVHASIRSKSFTSVLGTEFIGDDTGAGLDSILRLKATAGDVAGGAAAELVVLMQFRRSAYDYIGMRLHHFTTDRAADNEISGVGFFTQSAGREFDSSILIQGQNENGLAAFDAVIANIDRVSPAEVVVARSSPDDKLYVEGYKAKVRLMVRYSYAANGLSVRFDSSSVGEITNYEWTFDDGTGANGERSPVHVYAAPGSYTVKLKVTAGSEVQEHQRTITVSASSNSSGGEEATVRYALVKNPAYRAEYLVDGIGDLSHVKVDVGDMDKDGIAEVMSVARLRGNSLLRSVWKLADTSVPVSFAGRHIIESNPAFNGLQALDVRAADYDGDSLHAVLGTDCRQVVEPQVRQVVWLPPYFRRLQDQAWKSSQFGRTSTSGSSSETSFGTFTSHDVSAYIGVEIGGDAVGITATVKLTAGYNYQSERGESYGSENSMTRGQSFSQMEGEGLVVVEDNSFNCYSYDIWQSASGIDGGSGMRMCEAIEDSRYMSASDAQSWDTEIPAANPAHPPAQWMPLHRDWASLSLFRPVTSNVLSTVEAAKVTDGQFLSAASVDTASNQPFLQIDLGSIRDISGIRIVPSAGHGLAMVGYRLFASAQAFSGNGLPTGPAVRMYAPETADDVAYDRWNIWTRDRTDPSQMLRARYIRLQHPGMAKVQVAEIQVFGDVHLDPPAYPNAVCDPVVNDGVFKASVWDAVAGTFKAIDVRGDLLWDGTSSAGGASGVPGCANYTGTGSGAPQRALIWGSTTIGASGTVGWNIAEETQNMVGQSQGFQSAVRVGAEFDLELGFIVTTLTGGSYEFTSGITEEVQSTSYWGSGLAVGGEIGGFAPEYGSLINNCRYNPRPYAYKLTDRSNTGYRHDIYMVDYIVREGPSLWTRNNVPVLCYTADRIFKNGFE